MPKQQFRNTFYTNDNLYVLSGLNSGLVDLIYLDPPFNTKRTFSAPAGSKAAGASFKDMWTWNDVDEYYLDTLAATFPALTTFIACAGEIHGKPMAAYLTYMSQRMVEMYRILKETGSLYLHCDPTAGHYLKILLDEIFGKNNCRNEIVWCYTGPGSSGMRQFNRKSDTIFWYSKGKTWTFNKDVVRMPYKDGKPHRGGFVEKDGTRLVPDKYSAGKVPENWWTDIAIVARGKHERTGYPTQKPLALLKRIILASSHKGDIVMDPFCGCATTCVAAQQLDRRWIGIDIEKQAVKVLAERLSADTGLVKDFAAAEQVPKRSDLKTVLPSSSVKKQLYREQQGKCNACGEELGGEDWDADNFEGQHLNIDYIIPKSKGGGDYYENYQLLCAHCNRIKAKRPMEYLRLKTETRKRRTKNTIFWGE